MAAGTSIEILDLRHFGAPSLRPVLEAEGELWRKRLHWDYRSSARLLMQYLDSHMLPGFVALDGEHPIGYVFSVYEDTKAVIGEVFALPNAPASAGPPQSIEEALLTHLLELLTNSPQVERIESQLLLHRSGSHSRLFAAEGFEIFRRLFMVQDLQRIGPTAPRSSPAGFEMRAWSDDDLNAAARLICEAYRGHPDSLINDQYRTVHGSMRFLNNIVRYSGCGAFAPQVSHVVLEWSRREIVALVLGSRVSPQSGHITQLCVHPAYRRRGLAQLLLAEAASQFKQLGVTEISLTVTEVNTQAIELYKREGYTCEHMFDASVWERGKHF